MLDYNSQIKNCISYGSKENLFLFMGHIRLGQFIQCLYEIQPGTEARSLLISHRKDLGTRK